MESIEFITVTVSAIDSGWLDAVNRLSAGIDRLMPFCVPAHIIDPERYGAAYAFKTIAPTRQKCLPRPDEVTP